MELAESPSRLLRLPPLYWHLKTFKAKHPFINVIQLMEHEALRVESVCTKIYVKVQKKNYLWISSSHYLLCFITTQLINGHILNPTDTLPLFHLILLLYTNVPKECYVY